MTDPDLARWADGVERLCPEAQVVRVLRYLPGRRVSTLVRTARGAGVLKVYASSRARGVHRRLSLLAESAAGDLVPRPMGHWKGHTALVEYVRGTPLDHLEVDRLVQAAAEAGRGLRRVHESGVLLDRSWTMEEEVAQVRRMAGPATRAAAEEAIRRWRARDHDRLVPSHRDCYPAQVILTRSGIRFIDLDDVTMAPPGLDVGNFTAHLRRDAALRRRSADAASRAIGAFLAGYGIAWDDLVPWERLSLVRLAALAETRHDSLDEARMLLRTLGAAEAFASTSRRRTAGETGDVASQRHGGVNPFVFVVGCPRSGTTLLQRMLNHHPELAVANDTHFVASVIEGRASTRDLPLTQELVETVVGHHRFHRLGVSEAAARRIADEARTYREFVSELYSELARLCDKQFGGDKTPEYVRHLPLLHRLFPWTKSVHIIRDGRDVALSTLEWASKRKGPGRLNLWKENPVAVCALWWRWLVGTGRRDGTKLSPYHHRELLYESLVADPETELRGLARFLDLPFAPEMLTYYVGRMQNEPDLSAKGAWLPPTPGLRDWRTQMAPQDAELFEAIAGHVLSELGYERAFPIISSKVAALADEWRNRWSTEGPRAARTVRK